MDIVGKVLAKIITYLFHPLLSPTLGMFILINSGTHIANHDPRANTFIYLITLMSTLLFPLLFLPFFLYRNMIKSIAMNEHKERVYPLLLTAVFYFFGFYLLQSYPFHEYFAAFLLASAISIVFIMIISLKWKISAHMAGIGGLIGLILAISLAYQVNLQLFFIVAFLISGFIGFARLKLNAHSAMQVAAGFALGFLTVLITILAY